MLATFASLLFCFGCAVERDHLPERGLYEWRSVAEIEARDLPRLDTLGVTRLFVRFFDVQEKSGGDPVARSTVRFAGDLPSGLDLVPTIYITNESLRSIRRPEQIDSLAVRIVRKVREMTESANHPAYGELQIDCDWSRSTQATYFRLLEQIDAALPSTVRLSATIRLHQIKYRVETGVPPVDRGLLMVYNTGEVTSPEETNAILSLDIVEQYIGDLHSYPLPLDVALPIFSWGVRFHYGRFASLMPELSRADLQGIEGIRQIDDHRWEVLRSQTLADVKVTIGDVIRLEETPPEYVLPIAERVAEELPDENRTILIYRYDPQIFLRYETNRLLPLYRAFE